MLGKIDSPLNQKLAQVKWGEFKISKLFNIENTLSFNADKLVNGSEYDYVTRTSLNQGVLKTTGFVNERNLNDSGNWSLGLLQMDFFYRRNPWYAGQFVRKISPKFAVTDNTALFFTTILNGLKKDLLSVLVRNVDNIFLNSTIQLPINGNGEIDFGFIDGFVAELEGQRVAELQAYLSVTGLSDYTLTEEEKHVIEQLNEIPFKTFKITSIFDIKNTGNILSRDIIENSGSTPYLCASRENNAVSSYITYNEDSLDKGNCVFIGGKTFVVTYQKNDFFSNDSHNLVLYLKKKDFEQQNILLYLVACVNRSLRHKYSWGDSISNKKIKSDVLMLPVNKNEPNYELMATLISAVKKLVIKDVVNYADKKIALTKEVISKS